MKNHNTSTALGRSACVKDVFVGGGGGIGANLG